MKKDGILDVKVCKYSKSVLVSNTVITIEARLKKIEAVRILFWKYFKNGGVIRYKDIIAEINHGEVNKSPLFNQKPSVVML